MSQSRDRINNEGDRHQLRMDQSRDQRHLERNLSLNSTYGPKHAEFSIGEDLRRQLKSVSIPTFDGRKALYENWRAAFDACIDKAPATPEYKFLQLRQYLSGEALTCVENLGYSAEAYRAAKNRLERKYGGSRRRIALFLEQIESMQPIRNGSAKDIETFADLLEVAVINLKDVGRYDELGCGSFYVKLQKKLPEQMLVNYHRWLHDDYQSESVDSLRNWVLREAEYQVTASETIKGVVYGREALTRKETPTHRGYFGEESAKRKTCKECGEAHGIWSCEKFERRNITERWQRAKDLNLCYCCLGSNHFSNSCFWKRKCGVDGCKIQHHRLLHDAEFDKSKRDEAKYTRNTSFKTELKKNNGDYLALRTVPIILRNGNLSIAVNALLDDGSTKTYVNADVAAQLRIQGKTEHVHVNVLNNQTSTFKSMSLEVVLESLDGRVSMPIEAFATERVTGTLKAINWNNYKKNWNHLSNINFPTPSRRPFVDILIGLDYSNLHVSLKEVSGGIGGPSARLTPLGWTCVGHPEGHSAFSTNFVRTFFMKQEPLLEIQKTLRSFWEIENVSSEYPVKMSKEDEQAEMLLTESLTFKEGRYHVAMPWRTGAPKLPSNFNMAFRRLQITERKLEKNHVAKEAYKKTIDEYEQKGYIHKVEKDDVPSERTWYLPHFPVIRMDKATTKTRIVFDASARQDGISLNDALLPGPKLQRDLFAVLLRFRRFPVAVVCDIQEMYLQIGIAEADRSYLRFLWRNMDESIKPVVYEFERVVFGITSSPFQAQFVARKHAGSLREEYPRASETGLESTYMDDSMDSVQCDEEGKELYQELSNLWKRCGMHARKWLSNSTAVLESIPIEDRAEKIDISGNELPSIKTLGICWIAAQDQFTFKSIKIEDQFSFTKRNFLKKIATIFDPLGFLTPFVIRGKIMMQSTWESGADWDDILPEYLTAKMKIWFEELKEIENLRIPRCIRLPQDEKELELRLHGFCDASELAIGAVVYATSYYDSGKVISRLVAAKTKVAPLTVVSIPRLELMGAVLSLRLTLTAAKALKINPDKAYYWTDSMNVLWWIQSASRHYKPFVANRVGEIQSSSSPPQWQHVPGNSNPADLLTRGIKAEHLVVNQLWWNGPEFINKDEDHWPKKKVSCVKADKELKRSAAMEYTLFQKPACQTIEAVQQPATWRLDPTRYSNWRALKRVLAWVFRWCKNCKMEADSRVTGELYPEEIDEAEIWLVKQTQKEHFPEEYKALLQKTELKTNSKLLSLKPVLDEEGLMRSDGRLKDAKFLPFNMRFPILLPRHSWVTKLIIFDKHTDDAHNSGTNQILAALSVKYWIIAGREAIREVESKCYECRRRKRAAAKQVMAPLPSERAKIPARPFVYSAVDYGGPFITIQGRRLQRAKRYLCLFTCLHSRAVHLEMAYSMDTDAFLNAFYRMANRRGLPRKVLSDNGGNFVGADKELKSLVKQLNQNTIIKSTANEGVEWQFNPPLTPHFGGAFEVMIKAAKRATYAILSNADITDEELMTAFTGAESLINSRPLTYQSANPRDVNPITPNHFLHGQMGGEFAPDSVDETPFSPRKRWRRVQELVRHYWHRWLKEWLPTLTRRQKWHKTYQDIQKGDIVLVMRQDVPRGKWPLGKILEVYPGRDGHVRVAKVLVNEKEITRSIYQLIPLECDERN